MSREPRAIWTFDCETDPFHECRDPKRPLSNVRDPRCPICKGQGRIPQPFLYGLYDGANFQYYEFTEPEEVFEFVADKRILVYAHNGGKFDYHYIKDYINQDERIMVIAGRLAKFRIGEAEFRDSLSIFSQTRLADFSKEEIDYRIFEPEERDKPANRKKISSYLKSDCVNLYNLMQGFIETYGVQFTQAGAAMSYWSKMSGVAKPRSTPEFYNEYRSFYYGGRVQCFERGHRRERAHMVDVNSAYPRAMCEEHPYSVTPIVDAKLPKPDKIGPCMIELKAVAKGCFPLRLETGELLFPEDEKTTRTYFITGWEYLAALETNTVQVKKIVKVHHFPETVNFREYIDHFYKLRLKAKEAGDKAHDIFGKIFMNGTYGKFCANPAKYREYVLASDDRFDEWLEQGYIKSLDWGVHNLMTRELPEDKQRYYNIATGASITGWERANLWKGIQKCGGVIYGDTDSILARDVAKLPQGKSLGEWKLEFTADEWAVAGKKLYACHKTKPFHKELKHGDPEWSAEWKVASKGVRLDPKQVIGLARGERITYENPVPNYSVTRGVIDFIRREVRDTYKNVAIVGESFDHEEAA